MQPLFDVANGIDHQLGQVRPLKPRVAMLDLVQQTVDIHEGLTGGEPAGKVPPRWQAPVQAKSDKQRHAFGLPVW